MNNDSAPGNVRPNEGLGPVAWMWQHDETGRTGFVECWQVATGWQESNPRLLLVAPLYDLRAAPVAIMDTRDALGLCAPTEEEFPALYALQGRRVALVDMGPNLSLDQLGLV